MASSLRLVVCLVGLFCPFGRKIVDRIDTDKSGFVSHGELHQWIKHRQRRHIEENVLKHRKEYDQNKDGKIGWEEYKNTTYGYYLVTTREGSLTLRQMSEGVVILKR